MARTLALLSIALLAGCSEHEFHQVNYSQVMGELTISGRVCDHERNTWLAGATVYTHLIDDEGTLYATVETLTDEGGRFTLDRLVEKRDYTVYVQYGSTPLDMFSVSVGTTDVVLEEPECGGESGLYVALISGDYDDFETVLTEMGMTGYEVINGQTGEELVQFLSDGEHLSEYDALFFPGGHQEKGVIYDDGTSAADVAAVQQALVAYVEAGGTLFASDWSYDVVEQLWPDRIDFVGEDEVPDAAQVGEEAWITAVVKDNGLEKAVDSKVVDITFDLDAWPVMKYAPSGTRLYLKGDVPYRVGMETRTQSDAPLLVSFPEGEGKVWYSSWRLSSNMDGDAGKVVSFALAHL